MAMLAPAHHGPQTFVLRLSSASQLTVAQKLVSAGKGLHRANRSTAEVCQVLDCTTLQQFWVKAQTEAKWTQIPRAPLRSMQLRMNTALSSRRCAASSTLSCSRTRS